MTSSSHWKNEDLGKAFYEKLTARSGSRLTDFSNNSFHVVTELTHKNGDGNWAGSVGILHGESMAEEMKLFLKCGYRLEETIRCGSENGAGLFGMEKLGRLTVGRKATFLIARGTVQQLPRKRSCQDSVTGAFCSTGRRSRGVALISPKTTM